MTATKTETLIKPNDSLKTVPDGFGSQLRHSQGVSHGLGVELFVLRTHQPSTRSHCSGRNFFKFPRGDEHVPIIDYEKRADKAEQRVFDNPKIPDATKTILRRFLTAYDVSAARRQIFCDKIPPLLVSFDNIEDALTDRDAINEFFAALRKRYSPASYATYINVVRRFLSWLNRGERPQSLCDLRGRTIKGARRNLSPEDMLTWEDGCKIADAAFSVQLSAICLTQLDCGFRPSEFVDLNYGDVEVRTGLAVFHIRNGKTGSRSVVAHRCVPVLLKWMDAHPTKRPEDPLWVVESELLDSHQQKLRIRRYAYPAMKKRLRMTGERAGIRKPLDFYSLRHSSCVLDKLDNLPTDLAAERHGHSVKHYVGTYGRLSVKDVMRRFHSHYGSEPEETPSRMEHLNCPTCNHINTHDSKWCSSCGTPLSAIGAVEVAKEHGLTGISQSAQLQLDLETMKAELAESKDRENAFRREQLQLLTQVKDIRSVLLQEKESITTRNGSEEPPQ